jgi:hypothetical protein
MNMEPLEKKIGQLLAIALALITAIIILIIKCV